MQKILVTGGAGFIGSHLCEKLLVDGYVVICVDNFVTGSKKNIEHLLNNPNFELIEADITSSIEYPVSNVDFIFDLASPASPVDFENLSEEILKVNSVGVLNLLELARKNNSKILITSTSEIYGDPLEHPQKESYWGNANSFGPRACYDESKRFAEAATYVYIHKYDLDARIIRIFNTYGPKMKKNDGRVVSNFINQAINNESITIYGDGKQTRSFCFVSDMVDGLCKAMFSENTKGEVLNLGNPGEFTMLELADKVRQLTNSSSKIVFKPLPQDDPKQRKPDITKAKEVLRWEPKVNLEEGLQKTIEYYKNIS